MSPRRTLVLAAIALALAACQKPATDSDLAKDDAQAEATTAAAVAPPQESSQENVGRELDPATTQLVEFAASMNAVEYGCDLSTKSQSDASAEKSRQMMVERGFSAAEHDRVYQAAFNKAVDKNQRLSAADQAKACAELKAFGEKAATMAPGA